MDSATISQISRIAEFSQRRQANSRRWQLEAYAEKLERLWRQAERQGFVAQAKTWKREALQVRMEIGREAMMAYW